MLLQLPPHKLKTIVGTRWNNAIKLIERFLEQQAAICAALPSPQVRGCSGDHLHTERNGHFKC